MKPLEMSLLAVGAVVSLVAGGAAARFALGPLNDAYARHGAVVADDGVPAPSPIAVSTPATPPSADGSVVEPSPAVFVREEKPPIVRVRHDRAVDGGDRSGRDGEDGREDDATAYSPNAAPRSMEVDDRQDAPPFPRDSYHAERRPSDSPPWIDEQASADTDRPYDAPPEPY